MNYLEKVKIDGFWGDRKIVMDFNRDVNFLIGVNGSGKTTVIEIIAAALTANFPALTKLPFIKIQLGLKQISGNKKPSIEVEKIVSKKSRLPKIKFQIKNKASEKAINYSLDSYARDRFLWEKKHALYYHRQQSLFDGDEFDKNSINLEERLSRMLNLSWLTIHRTKETYDFDTEESFESSIDRKLHELSNELIKFFSQLDKLAIEERDKLQKSIFLSLISSKNRNKIGFQDFNIDKEKTALSEIFKLFNLSEKDFKSDTENHFKSYKNAYKKVKEEKGEGLDVDDLLVLFDTSRIHNVVQDWNALTNKQREIYEPRDTFLSVLNKLLQRKQIQINDKNELIVKTESGKIFPLKYLSSGEKQLLIILGEALFQKTIPWVYIADEPELSLHVSWQESLVRNLRTINPNAQIIFATHSPDIVSSFSNCVFDMEKIIL